MKKTILIASLALLCGVAAVCARPSAAQTKRIFSSKHLKEVSKTTSVTESYSLEVGHEMLVTPLLASVKLVETPEQGAPVVFVKEYTLPVNLVGRKRVFRKNDNLAPFISQLKTEAIFDCCRKYNADLIVMPQFKIRYKTSLLTGTDDRGKTVTVDYPVVVDGKYIVEVCLAGHPAVYSNFRDAEHGSTEKETLVILPNGTTTNSKLAESEGAEWIKNLYKLGAADNQEQIAETTRSTRLHRKTRNR